MLVAAHKFGVIFAKENQITENELFSNSTHSHHVWALASRWWQAEGTTLTALPVAVQRKATRLSRRSSSCWAQRSNSRAGKATRAV
jgi:hypothetical protein